MPWNCNLTRCVEMELLSYTLSLDVMKSSNPVLKSSSCQRKYIVAMFTFVVMAAMVAAAVTAVVVVECWCGHTSPWQCCRRIQW